MTVGTLVEPKASPWMLKTTGIGELVWAGLPMSTMYDKAVEESSGAAQVRFCILAETAASLLRLTMTDIVVEESTGAALMERIGVVPEMEAILPKTTRIGRVVGERNGV